MFGALGTMLCTAVKCVLCVCVFSEWEKNEEGDWERRIGLLPKDAFLYRSIMWKNTHLIIVDLKVVSSKLILFVPVYALGGLHMNIAQFEDYWGIEKKNGPTVRI